MKLIIESSHQVEVLNEKTIKGNRTYIEGPFLMAEAVNRNGRFYSKEVLEESVANYVRDYINERRATGELNHPEYPFPDPKKAAIMIEKLEWKGNNVIGKALVLNTPDGLIIQELLNANFKLGVSTRGLGDTKKRPDGASAVTKFAMGAIDAVDLPSGQVCYVDQINESVNWVNRNGIWVKENATVITEEAEKKGIDPEAFLAACRATFARR